MFRPLTRLLCLALFALALPLSAQATRRPIRKFTPDAGRGAGDDSQSFQSECSFLSVTAPAPP